MSGEPDITRFMPRRSTTKPGEAQRPSLPKGVDFDGAAECLKTLAHPGRLRLVSLLLEGRFSVGALAAATELSPTVTSEHLRLLERCGLLRSEREGRRVFYSVAEPLLGKIIGCVHDRFAA